MQGYISPRDAVEKSRRRYHESLPGSGGMFSGMRAVVVMREPRRRAVYR